MHFLPKRMLICTVPDKTAYDYVQAIIQVNQSGNHGDGKIFVRPLELFVEPTAVFPPMENEDHDREKRQ